jgi:hypothetical protein
LTSNEPAWENLGESFSSFPTKNGKAPGSASRHARAGRGEVGKPRVKIQGPRPFRCHQFYECI